MFIVMFEFVPKPGKDADFLAAWPKVTQGIYLFKAAWAPVYIKTKMACGLLMPSGRIAPPGSSLRCSV